ncbi:catechol 1,2-dioxygenase [Cupriavidus sp. TA19]|uniref:dioxygenase family protein n=1 Tax=unclassified Cupriavidus TaxID=2640874 RepID=UPI000E2F3A41|nr:MULTISPECIES: dioxygenase [unclassified Cupriavidus]BDB29890.1 catechol 1,2-dioxygenase [Cupriavidus sp. P-10]GLC95991.1 catechol 1,2-dioxygenase [Cupriavidus sp. TA19]
MADMNAKELLQLVNSARVEEGDERVRAISARIVSDLFRTIDEYDVSPDEFWAAVKWLTRLGQADMVGLITAGLGFDRLLDIRLDEADQKAGRELGTPRAIEGPLYVAGAPLYQGEVRLDEGNEGKGEPFVMEGRVLDKNNKPVANAIVDVWHCNENGRYSHFDPSQPDYNLRRRIETDAKGQYRFRSFLPPGYAIPPNSPVSELFGLLGRHGNRPAHIHFMVSAAGKRTLTTQVNLPGDTFLDDDFAFATRDGLVVQLEAAKDPADYASLGLSAPFTRVRFDFVLPDAASAREAAVASRYETAAA